MMFQLWASVIESRTSSTKFSTSSRWTSSGSGARRAKATRIATVQALLRRGLFAQVLILSGGSWKSLRDRRGLFAQALILSGGSWKSLRDRRGLFAQALIGAPRRGRGGGARARLRR